MRHQLQDDDAYALCSQESETVLHLLHGCVFAVEIWHRLLSPLDMGHLLASGSGQRRGFDSLLLLASWCIWKERIECSMVDRGYRPKSAQRSWRRSGTFGSREGSPTWQRCSQHSMTDCLLPFRLQASSRCRVVDYT
jgi:hypothetical protein